MNEHPLPMFDESLPDDTPPTPPKKPKPKPTRKRRKRKAVKVESPKRVPIKRRKRRVAKAKPVEQNGGRFTPEVYDIIGRLMNLETPLRNLAIEVAKGLSK